MDFLPFSTCSCSQSYPVALQEQGSGMHPAGRQLPSATQRVCKSESFLHVRAASKKCWTYKQWILLTNCCCCCGRHKLVVIMRGAPAINTNPERTPNRELHINMILHLRVVLLLFSLSLLRTARLQCPRGCLCGERTRTAACILASPRFRSVPEGIPRSTAVLWVFSTSVECTNALI